MNVNANVTTDDGAHPSSDLAATQQRRKTEACGHAAASQGSCGHAAAPQVRGGDYQLIEYAEAVIEDREIREHVIGTMSSSRWDGTGPGMGCDGIAPGLGQGRGKSNETTPPWLQCGSEFASSLRKNEHNT